MQVKMRCHLITQFVGKITKSDTVKADESVGRQHPSQVAGGAILAEFSDM